MGIRGPVLNVFPSHGGNLFFMALKLACAHAHKPMGGNLLRFHNTKERILEQMEGRTA